MTDLDLVKRNLYHWHVWTSANARFLKKWTGRNHFCFGRRTFCALSSRRGCQENARFKAPRNLVTKSSLCSGACNTFQDLIFRDARADQCLQLPLKCLTIRNQCNELWNAPSRNNTIMYRYSLKKHNLKHDEEKK